MYKFSQWLYHFCLKSLFWLIKRKKKKEKKKKGGDFDEIFLIFLSNSIASFDNFSCLCVTLNNNVHRTRDQAPHSQLQ